MWAIEPWDYCAWKIPILMEIDGSQGAESYSIEFPIVVEHPSYLQKFKDLFQKWRNSESNEKQKTGDEIGYHDISKH
jgi:hypothetical protein